MAGPGQGLQQLFTQALGQMAPSAGAFNPMGVLQSAEQAGQRDQTLALQSDKFAWDKGQDIIGNQQNAEKMALDREKDARDQLLFEIKQKAEERDQEGREWLATNPDDTDVNRQIAVSYGYNPDEIFSLTEEEEEQRLKDIESHKQQEIAANRKPDKPTTATKVVINNKTGKAVGSFRADSPDLDRYFDDPDYTVATPTAQGTPEDFGGGYEQKQNRDSVRNSLANSARSVTILSKGLNDFNNAKGTAGIGGAVSSNVSGYVGQLFGDEAATMFSKFWGVEDREKTEQFKQDFAELTSSLIPAYTGEQGSRVSDVERRIAKEISNLGSIKSDEPALRASMVNIMSLQLQRADGLRGLIGRERRFETETTEGRVGLLKTLKQYGLEKEEAIQVAKDLGTFYRELDILSK